MRDKCGNKTTRNRDVEKVQSERDSKGMEGTEQCKQLRRGVNIDFGKYQGACRPTGRLSLAPSGTTDAETTGQRGTFTAEHKQQLPALEQNQD